MRFALPEFYADCERRFAAALDGVGVSHRAAMQRYRMAPFASDPEATLRPGELYVLSMKPYAVRGRVYPFGREERAARPGLHRWLDGPRRHSNFCREAVALLGGILDALGSDCPPREVFNTYATFFRAEDARQLRGWGLAHVDCSELHRPLLSAVRPRVVLCIGNGPDPSALATLLCVTGVEPAAVTAVGVAPRTYVKHFRACVVDGAKPSLILGVPHLSYVRAAQLLPTVRELVRRSAANVQD